VLPIALGVAAGLFALVALVLYVAGRSRAHALSDDVKMHIEPYLRRKAAEHDIPAEAPTWTSRTPPEEIVGYSARLAARLLGHEKAGPPSQTTNDLELAQTQPVSSSDEIVVSTGKTQKQQSS
jgi:hypothetical protein